MSGRRTRVPCAHAARGPRGGARRTSQLDRPAGGHPGHGPRPPRAVSREEPAEAAAGGHPTGPPRPGAPPATARGLLEKCLEKSLQSRLPEMALARITLEEAL